MGADDNPPMLCRFQSVLVASLLALAACSPTFNWRDVRLAEGVALKALLPCKPDRGSRPQVLAGQTLTLHMAGCDAGEALFAITYTDLPEPGSATAIQQQWQALLLANMKVQTPQQAAFSMRGATGPLQPVWLSANGQHHDGQAVRVQAVWFAQGARLYHAAVYASKLDAEVAQTFLTGLKFE